MRLTTPLLIGSLTLSLAACTQAGNPLNDADLNTTPASEASQMSSAGVAAKRRPVEWNVSQIDKNADGMPVMALTLKLSETGEALFHATCNGTTSTANLNIDGSIASIQCWWAGGGDQYAVFVDSAEKLVVKHRTVDEQAGFGAWQEVH